MLLFLRDSAPEDAAFVKLNDNPVVPSNGVNVTVIGHGLTDPNGIAISEDLLEVDVNIVSNQKCSESEGYYEYYSWWGETIQEYGSLDGMITDNMLCAMDHGEDACQGKFFACLHFMFQMQYFFFFCSSSSRCTLSCPLSHAGDSGGPLVLKGSDLHGNEDVQVGVVSWGYSCADPDFPGVYSRVSSAYQWIRTEVCLKSQYPPDEFDCESITRSPTLAPTPQPTMAPTVSSQPTMAPTVSCPPPYDSSLEYSVGERVNFGDEIFICQPKDGIENCIDESDVWQHVKACCPQEYDDTRTDYQAYDKVSLDGMIFECQPGDYEEYCNIHEEDWDWSYDELELWYDAWIYVGSC